MVTRKAHDFHKPVAQSHPPAPALSAARASCPTGQALAYVSLGDAVLLHGFACRAGKGSAFPRPR